MEAGKTIFNSIFGGKKKKAEAAPPPLALPDPDSPLAKLAAIKKARIRARRGREGTIYSQTAGPYSGNGLGGTT
jgi:hypothetical protein